MPYSSVIASGGSAVVVLPKRFRDLNGISVGDRVRVDFPNSSMMTITPVSPGGEKRLGIFDGLCKVADRTPIVGDVPQTREEEREILAGRYE